VSNYEKQNQQVYIKNMYVCCINSVASYMFRLPIVAIFKEVFFEGYIT